MKQIEIRHVANAGVILKLGELSIGVDILCDEILPYRATPEDVERQVLNPEYCPGLDYVIITHEHPDHFSKNKMIDFLLWQPRARVISNEAVIEDLQDKIDRSRLITVSKDKDQDTRINDKGAEIEIFHSTHMGPQFKDIMNLCAVISWQGIKILLPGDAEPRELLTGDKLKNQRLQFLIVPFPYITLNSVRKLVKEIVRPEKIFVFHLPSEDKDRDGMIRKSKEIYKKEGSPFPYTVFGEQIGVEYNFGFREETKNET